MREQRLVPCIISKQFPHPLQKVGNSNFFFVVAGAAANELQADFILQLPFPFRLVAMFYFIMLPPPSVTIYYSSNSQLAARNSLLLTLHSQGEARAARLPLRVRRPAGIRARTLPLQLCQVHDFRALARHTHALQERQRKRERGK